MKTAAFRARFGAAAIGAACLLLNVARAASDGSSEPEPGAVRMRGGVLGVTYDVPLLQVPSFLQAAAAQGEGVQTLIQPPGDMEFSRSLGAQFWRPKEAGWSRPLAGSLLRESIRFDSMPMSSGPAVPVVRPLVSTDLQPLTGDGSLFSEASQVPGGLVPARHLSRSGGSDSGFSGWLGGLLLVVAFVALLLSQLRQFQRSGRRRRRRRSSLGCRPH